MKRNITLSADEWLIEKAREISAARHESLNQAFRGWLERYIGRGRSKDEYLHLMQDMEQVEAGGSFSRDELNER